MGARAGWALTAVVWALAMAPAAGAQAPDAPACMMSLAAIKAPRPRFEDYAAPAEPIARPAAPIIATRETRQFRTRLREAAAKGPNFAGHYTIVEWGCGTGCIDWAIVDVRSGRVSFIDDLRDVSVMNVGEEAAAPDDSFDGFRYRRNSRLLAVLGAPREDEAREGVAFYLWDGGRLKRLAFFPKAKSCSTAQ